MAWYDYNISQGFKWTDHNKTAHSGIDLAVPWNTPVTAPLPGTVVFAQCRPWGGQVDVLVRWNGQNYVTTVLHLHSILVNQGQSVVAGQLLGYSGGDGRGPCPTQMPKYSNGPHVHFELTLGSVGPYHGGPPYKVTASSFTVDPGPMLQALKSGGGLSGGLTGYQQSEALPGGASAQETAVSLLSLDALFTLPQETVNAINAIPGVDNLIYRLHEAETFPGWKSLDQVAPLDANAQKTLTAAQVVTAGVAAVVGGPAAAKEATSTVGTLGTTLNPGRLVYWIAGNILGNSRAMVVRLLYMGIGGMLFLALVIALGAAQQEIVLHAAGDVVKDVAPVLEAGAMVA